MSVLPLFDPLLETADHRDLVRSLFTLVRTVPYGFLVAHGHAEAAAALIEGLARNYPDAGLRLLLAQRNPMRATSVFTGERPRIDTHEVDPAATATMLLRSFLRQDPDIVGLTQLDAESGPMCFSSATTGHLVLMGSAAAELESIVATLCGDTPGLARHVEESMRLVAEFSLDGKLARVRFRPERGPELVDVARVENGQVVLNRDLLPHLEAPPPMYTPHWAPPLSERTPPMSNVRTAHVITTTAADGPHLLGTRYAYRPSGASWPICGTCQQPLALIASLDLALLRNEPTRAQLFLCRAGACDVSSETAPGVVAELVPADGLFRLEAPDALKTDVVAPGAMELLAVEESSDDPLFCDKVGGWPSSGLHPELELLFQFTEGTVLEGGTRAGWDFTEARLVPGTPAKAVIDPNAPHHFPGEGVGALFHGPGRLAFRWQSA